MAALSVIVPSYNGAHKLPQLLEALVSQQSECDFELIVVVDGSTDCSEEVLIAWQSRFQALRIISQANGGRAQARNAGAAAAVGELLLFFDDDMRPRPGLLAAHQQRHKHWPQPSILIGQALEDYERLQTDLQRYRAYLSRHWAKPYEGLGEQPLPPGQVFLTAAHCSLPKQLFEQLQGFDEALTDAEDFDFAIRAAEAQVPMYFDTNLVAWHDDFITARSYVRRLREYKRAHEDLQMRKPELYARYTQYNYRALDPLRQSIYWLLACWPWLWLLDYANVFRYLPKRVRYRIYDLILTANGVYFPAD
ncbi:glycosyltransferase family 2 protein [Eisenibacter elegans]|jgi:glycosyltransferase involved in cell wall biosynthesis|uniref:glycosyltransferase family 2 protein n=1 Tax=Eisenibacter elegans TaxID=997 RepID=UPI000685BBAD|nr:glycosyltransferase family 2 protein [Eisenibacter elegans]